MSAEYESIHMSQFVRFRFSIAIMLAAAAAKAQDMRTVVEPVMPPACAVVNAHLVSHGGKLDEAGEKTPDTARIQAAIDTCTAGRAVTLRADAGHDAFLSGPLQLRKGVTLVVDAGAILFASRNPRDYDLRPGVCGTIDASGHGCRALINGDHAEDARL